MDQNKPLRGPHETDEQYNDRLFDLICKSCEAPRFMMGEGKNNVVPKAFPYIHFGIKYQIQALFSIPEWAQHYDTDDK